MPKQTPHVKSLTHEQRRTDTEKLPWNGLIEFVHGLNRKKAMKGPKTK